MFKNWKILISKVWRNLLKQTLNDYIFLKYIEFCCYKTAIFLSSLRSNDFKKTK